MLEREAWRFVNNRRADDAEYLRSLDSVSNQEERELLWKNYLREADQWEEECHDVRHSAPSVPSTIGQNAFCGGVMLTTK